MGRSWPPAERIDGRRLAIGDTENPRFQFGTDEDLQPDVNSAVPAVVPLCVY